VRTVAFDKTGTLTHGEPEVISIEARGALTSADELLGLVASAEQYSSHVLARAIVEDAKARGIALQEASHAKEVATHGVSAKFDSHSVLVGKPLFVGETVGEIELYDVEPGETVVYVGVDGAYAGYVVLRDVLRLEARSALDQLRALGVRRTLMVSGDGQDTTSHIANEVGISEARGGCLPQDKVRLIESLTPKSVMMVGDGVNDAPVLAVADVGVAMGAKGSTAASESADIVIMVDNLSVVPRALEIGQTTIKIALQSIWLGIIISVGLMVLAAFGFLPAIFGALLQEVVDLIAILGALRALREPPTKRLRASELVGAKNQRE